MNKKISIVVALLLLCVFEPAIKAGKSLGSMDKQITATESSNEEIEHNTFTLFTALPKDIQKEIIKYVWTAESSPEQFKKTLAGWKYTQMVRVETSPAERREYGYNGDKLPIHFYTYKDKKPVICDVGCIIQDAQPSMAVGFSYADSALPKDYIFLKKPFSADTAANLSYRAEIKRKANQKVDIYACSMSVNGDIAIVWKDQGPTHQSYVTFSTVANIPAIAGGSIDLNKNKIKLGHKSNQEIKGALFNLNGSQLAVPFYDIDSDPLKFNEIWKTAMLYFWKSKEILEQRESILSSITFFSTPGKHLHPEQILKRLMIAKGFPLTKSEQE